MLARQGPQVVADDFIEQLAARGGRLIRLRAGGQPLARHVGKTLAIDFHGRIHGDHIALADASLEPLQRQPGGGETLRHVEPVQQHGVIAGKVLLRVGQHTQAVLAYLRIRRIDVDYIDLALRQRFIGDAVIEAARALRQAITRGQAWPAVDPADEFMRQAEFQGRVLGQLRQAGDGFFIVAHCQRIRIVKAQRHGHAQSQRRQLAPHLRQVDGFVVLEDFAADGAHVFGIHVDAARLQRGQHDGRVAQALAVLRLDVRRGALLEDFAEDVRFREALRAHLQGATILGKGGHGCGGKNKQQQQVNNTHAALQDG
ncbi:hypothetical protein D3C87_1147030 [compost metagenome]